MTVLQNTPKTGNQGAINSNTQTFGLITQQRLSI